MSVRGAARAGLKAIEPQATVKGFNVLSKTVFEDYNVEVAEFEHEVTRARYMHIDTEDTNNAFCVGFCTPCTNDTGIAHILEHTALCGSERFPVRDPFFKMRNRSLSTFMNAMTYPDLTMYPFATVNEKDFYNLMSIYLDAAFFPRLSFMDFLQEGHRLEMEDGKFVIKGVVFNEMKGVFSDPSSLFFTKTMMEAYGKDSCYGHNYGGDPQRITELTHENLVAFHRRYYSPANCTFVTYGDLGVAGHLERIDETLLRRFEADGKEHRTRQTLRPKPQPLPPKTVQSTGPLDPLCTEEDNGMRVCLAWVLDIDPTDALKNFAWSILSSLLTSGPNAPLYKALVEAGLGRDFTAGTGFSGYLKGGFFEVGLQGVQEKTHTADAVTAAIVDTLKEVVQEGFPATRVESVLHQVELSKAHRSAGWGVDVSTTLVHAALQGYPTTSVFETTKIMTQLRAILAEDGNKYFESLVEEMLANQHRLQHEMRPDAQHPDALADFENNTQTPQLAAGADAARVEEQTAELKQEMDKKEDLSILPNLKVAEDVPAAPLPDPRVDLLTHERMGRWQNVVVPTNGVWYMRLGFPIAHLSPAELKQLPLLCTLLGSTGAGGLDYRALDQELKLCCSGVGASPSVATEPKAPEESHAYVYVTSYGLERSWERFWELTTKVLTEPNLDGADEAVRLRVQNIISMTATDAINGVVDSAHSYALKQAAAAVNPHARCSDLLNGMSQVAYLKETMSATQQEGDAGAAALTALISDLRALAGKVLATLPGAKLSITTAAPLSPAQQGTVAAFLDALPPAPAAFAAADARALSAIAALPPAPPSEGMTFVDAPCEVGYVATVKQTGLSYLHRDMAAAEVLLKILDTKFLHKEVREKGGAYGSGAVSSAGGADGIVGMWSYRDPAPNNTHATYGRCLAWLREPGNVSDDAVNEAKLLVFAGIDAPKSPQVKGLREFLSDLKMDDVRAKRERLLSVTPADVLAVAEALLGEGWHEPARAAGGEGFVQASAAVGGEKIYAALQGSDAKWTKPAAVTAASA